MEREGQSENEKIMRRNLKKALFRGSIKNQASPYRKGIIQKAATLDKIEEEEALFDMPKLDLDVYNNDEDDELDSVSLSSSSDDNDILIVKSTKKSFEKGSNNKPSE